MLEKLQNMESYADFYGWKVKIIEKLKESNPDLCRKMGNVHHAHDFYKFKPIVLEALVNLQNKEQIKQKKVR